MAGDGEIDIRQDTGAIDSGPRELIVRRESHHGIVQFSGLLR